MEKSLEELWTEEVYEAAAVGDLKRLKKLIEYSSPDMSHYDAKHCSALHYGVRSGNAELVQYLIERIGLDPLKANAEGVTAWDEAHSLGKQEVLDYFQERYGYSWEETYHNPIRRGFFPDPSIVRVGQDYYMVNSSFVFFPCIPISHSRDLIHWNIIGYAITDPEYAHLEHMNGGMGYWAADISWCDGRFYITATLRCNDDMPRKRVQMVTSSLYPQGPYDEPVFLDDDGIDPSIFHDDDGRKYMLLNRGARILELSRDCRSILKPGQLLWYGDKRRKPEGPHLLKKDGYYYLFLAEGGTGMGHCITTARSRDMYGPYEPSPYNPLLHQWDEEALIQCCGHGKPVQLPDGRWCIVYLCLRKMGGEYGILGRETAIDMMDWTRDGWPVINRGRGPSDQQVLPLKGTENSGEGSQAEPVSPYPFWKKQDWMTPRALEKGKLWQQEDQLFMVGNGADLNEHSCRSVLLRRQSAFRFQCSCSFAIPELKEGESQGLTCYYDENSYIKFGAACQEGEMGILLQEYIGDGYRSSRFKQAAFEEIREISLKVEADNLIRRFFYKKDGQWELIAELEDTSYLSSEGLKKGKRFTGATIGIYVHGIGCKSFQDWRYIESCDK